MKKLLILNGSHSDIPLIKAGKNLGYYVITSGNRPDLVGHRFADEYIGCDYSDKEKMLETFKDKGLDAIYTCANDFGAITAAYMAEKLGMHDGHDSYEATITLHHKDLFKKFAVANGLHTPHAVGFNNVYDALLYEPEKYPVMVKPIDLTGGKGVSKANNHEEYKNAVKAAVDRSPSKRIVVEPFILGTYHSFSTFIISGKVVAYFSDNEYSYKNPFLISTSAGPATGIDLVKDVLIEDAEKTAKVLNLCDGLFHCQYILSDGKPYIIEITRRLPGDLYMEPVRQATGIDWTYWAVRAACGLSCEEFPKNMPQTKLCGRHCVMGDKNGIVKDIIISDEIRDNIYDCFMWFHKGFEITNYMVDKLGILFLEYKDVEEMTDKVSRINELVKVVY